MPRLKTIAKIRWIPVEKESPDEGATVFMALANGEVDTGFLHEGFWRYANASLITDTVVTWWAGYPIHPFELRNKKP